MKQETPHKIALNVKETLEAKELLRQRHLPDGTVENLVLNLKFCCLVLVVFK